MAVKILVVEDSATMRKIMEMTFAGENAQVVTLDNGEAAAAKAEELKPDVVFADVSNKFDAYAVAQAIKSRPSLANVAVVALSSQHAAYDAAKGQAAGIDDHVVKPFDTQAVIDKLAAVLARPRAQPTGAARAPSAAPAAGMFPPPAPRPPAAPVAAPAPAPAVAAAAAQAGRDLKRTMAFGTPLTPITSPVGPVQSTGLPVPAAPPAPVPPAPAAAKPSLEIVEEPVPLTTPRAPAAPAPVAPPVVKPPAPVPAAAPAPSAAAPVAAVAAAATSALEQKLAGLGLTKAQVEGVLALSREVVEQVVWEVVPELAETIIREEIKRLTS